MQFPENVLIDRMEGWMEKWTDPILWDPSGYSQGSNNFLAKVTFNNNGLGMN